METSWYIHPVGKNLSHTNEMITQRLAVLYGSGREHAAMPCADGKERGLIDVPDFNFVSNLIKDKSGLQIEFEVFISIDGAKPKRWKLAEVKKKLRVTKKGLVRWGARSFRQRYPKKK